MSLIKSFKIIFSAIHKHPLAKMHKLKAFYNVIKWQLSQLLFPGIKKVPFIAGTYLLAKKSMTGATGNIYFGLHEFEEMGFLLHFLRREDLFVDIGANVGSYTVLASGVCGATCMSFEPVPETFQHLKNNIAENKIGDLASLFNEAVGAEEGKLIFTSGLDTVNHVVADDERNAHQTIDVKVNTLDDKMIGNTSNLLIKIDAEGFETAVLKGMTNTLQKDTVKAIIIELNGAGSRYGYSDEKIHETLTAHHFLPYTYDPFMRKLHALATFTDTNTIYIRDLHLVKERIASASNISIFSESF